MSAPWPRPALERYITTPPLEPQAAFLELGQFRFDSTSLEGVLRRVAELAKRTVPHTTDVSVTLVRDHKATIAAFTGETALRLDESQHAPGHGPGLEAACSSGHVRIDDMAAETRWPDFTRRALETGVRSSLFVALPVQHAIAGALNLYSDQRDAFDDDATALAAAFAGYAAVAIANAHLYETNATFAQNLRRAMDTRAVIEQAKGILMARDGLDSTQSFQLLTAQSQQSNRKLRDIATELVASTQRDVQLSGSTD